VDCRGTHIKD